jgi:hypothetical protein
MKKEEALEVTARSMRWRSNSLTSLPTCRYLDCDQEPVTSRCRLPRFGRGEVDPQFADSQVVQEACTADSSGQESRQSAGEVKHSSACHDAQAQSDLRVG